MALGGDSTYHYALHPRQSGGDIVVKMMFGGGVGCGSVPATICLNMVKFVEASSETTYAELLGGATVFGGDGNCGVALQSVSPTVVEEGEATTFHVLGGGFSEGTTTRLVGAQVTRDPTALVLLSSGNLQATFDTRSMVGIAELVLVSESGDSASTSTQITSSATIPAYAPSSVILWTKPGRLTLPPLESCALLASATGAPSLMATLEALGVLEVRSCASASLEDPAVAASLASPAILDLFVLTLSDTSVVPTSNLLAADTANVRTSHPAWLLRALEVIPSDQLMAKSWHLRNAGSFPPSAGAVIGADSRASRAWETSTGATPLRVGVIDTGSQINHPDLVGRYTNLWRWSDGYPYEDNAGHGAPVAGIIAATGNGGGRAVGVNWSAEIASLKAGNDYGEFPLSNTVDALDHARSAGLKFVNMSFGGPMGFLEIEAAVYNCFHAGMFLAAASGNGEFGPTSLYPAAIYPYVVSVGASLWTGQRWRDDQIRWDLWGYDTGCPGCLSPAAFSVAGLNLRLLAPGGRFVPTVRGSTGYAEPDPTLLWFPHNSTNHSLLDKDSPWWGFGGTSAAAPVVTGAASLIRSVAGDSLGAEEIAHLLAMTARPVNPQYPGYNPNDGWGIIDIEQALRAVRPGMRIERGVAVGGVVVDTVAGPIVDLIDFPGLPSYLSGCQSSAYNLRRTVVFGEPFVGRPLVLKRTRGSAGALTIPTQIRSTEDGPVSLTLPRWEPTIDTLAAYPDSCVFSTRVWRLYKSGQRYWWPCPPEDARFAYTLVGIPTNALDVAERELNHRAVRLSVGPLPSRGRLTVEIVAPPETSIELDLLDVQGRCVRPFGSHGTVDGRLHLEFHVNNGSSVLEPGLYFLRAKAPSGSVTRKVAFLR